MDADVAEGGVAREPLLGPEVRRIGLETPRPCATATEAVDENIFN